MKPSPAIKNIIFDLGGVILDLSIPDTLKSFAALADTDINRIEQWYQTAEEFLAYEMGLMSDDDFRSFINRHFPTRRLNTEIDQSWNAMLLGLPKAKLDLVNALKSKYNVFLLSNTNAIHVKHINEVLLRAVPGALSSLDDYFHQAYYSHVMKKRKPNADIFEEVLDASNLNPRETLFLDDNHDNIAGAKKLGISTALVDTPDYILRYFNEA